MNLPDKVENTPTTNPISQGEKKLTSFGRELLANAATAGIISKLIEIGTKGGEGIGLLLSLGIPALGVASTLFDSSKSKESITVIKLELTKLAHTVDLIEKKLNKSRFEELRNLYGANLDINMYELIKNLFNEAVNAKTESIRNYCTSFIIFVGGTDFQNEEDLDFRKMYKCLELIKQLDDLDFKLLTIYSLERQSFEDSCNMEVSSNLLEAKKHLLNDDSISTLEIKLSINKLSRLGLFERETTLYAYEDPKTKETMVEQVKQVNSLDTGNPVLNDFNKYVFTYR